MKNIKLFEDLFGSHNEIFIADIKHDKVDVTLRNTTDRLRGGTPSQGLIHWEIPIAIKTRGVSIGPSATITSMELYIEMEDPETEDVGEETIIVDDNQINPEQFKTTIHKSPFVLTSVTIDMKGSEKPEDWEIDLEIGSTES